MASPWEHMGQRWLNARRFASHHAETSVGRVHYYDTGRTPDSKGPTLVALHGLSSGATPMAPVLRRLTGHWPRIVAPDMPGHGFSEAPERATLESLYDGVAELLARILDGPSVLFGHSLGGALALRLALERPELVAGLVLLSPAGAPTPQGAHERWLDRFSMVDQRSAHDFVRTLYVRQPLFLPVVAWTCRQLFHREPVRQLLSSTRREAAITAEQLGGITVPIRFIWGGAEQTLLPAHRDFFLAHLPPHAEVVTPGHFTHCPYLEYPDEVAAHVTSLMGKVSAGHEVAA